MSQSFQVAEPRFLQSQHVLTVRSESARAGDLDLGDLGLGDLGLGDLGLQSRSTSAQPDRDADTNHAPTANPWAFKPHAARTVHTFAAACAAHTPGVHPQIFGAYTPVTKELWRKRLRRLGPQPDKGLPEVHPKPAEPASVKYPFTTNAEILEMVRSMASTLDKTKPREDFECLEQQLVVIDNSCNITPECAVSCEVFCHIQFPHPALCVQYRNPWGRMRIGRTLEDLDSMAGNIAFAHSDDGKSDTLPPLLVTAAVERIALLRPLELSADVELSAIRTRLLPCRTRLL